MGTVLDEKAHEAFCANTELESKSAEPKAAGMALGEIVQALNTKRDGKILLHHTDLLIKEEP